MLLVARLQLEELLRSAAGRGSFTIIAQIQSHCHFFIHAFAYTMPILIYRCKWPLVKRQIIEIYSKHAIFTAAEPGKTRRWEMWEESERGNAIWKLGTNYLFPSMQVICILGFRCKRDAYYALLGIYGVFMVM